MAKPEWGIKRTCQVCGKKYYDLNKSPIICPCPEAVEFDPNDYLKTRKGIVPWFNWGVKSACKAPGDPISAKNSNP